MEKPQRKAKQASYRTRTAYAWIAICAAVVIAIALVVFIAQNAQPVQVTFLVWHGRFPLAVTLLAAAATSGAVATGIGSARILQLRSRRRSADVLPVPRVGAAGTPGMKPLVRAT
ncbi:lipopolysaccharide assembly protein LapA domain-containing protein [Catenulispora yoronensis]